MKLWFTCVCICIYVCVYYINACLCVDTERREDRIFVGNGGELLGDTCLSFRIDSNLIQISELITLA